MFGKNKAEPSKSSDKKDKAKKQKVKKQHKSPIQYLREVWFELKKVTWPTKKELISYTLAVLTFVAITVVVVYLFDLGLSELFTLIAQ
nr:preprotein translocase subunit SecE [bacterium]